MMEYTVETYNEEGRCLYLASFPSAEKAHEEYLDCIRCAKDCLPKGRSLLVARYTDGIPMAMETIVGTVNYR